MWPGMQGGAGGWGNRPPMTPFGPNSPGWGSLPPAVQQWMTANPNWMQTLGRPQGGPPGGAPWWQRGPGSRPPTLSGRQPLSAVPYKPVGRSPGGDPLVPNTGQVGTPVPMNKPVGGLLAQLFDPAQHAGLRYAGMANAGNKGIDYTSASSRGLTDQILGQPIPTGGFGIGTGLPGGVSGLGTPVNVRAARLAATPDADQAAQVAAALPGGPDWWNTVMSATRR